MSGLDLQKSEKGTWLGINRAGRIAVITNYIELPLPTVLYPKSRGGIVKDLLNSDLDLEQQLNSLKSHPHEYDGFNLICSDLGLKHPEVLYYSNKRTENDIQRIPSGDYHGLSNSLLKDPWPKVELGISKFKSVVEDYDLEQEELIKRLLEMLR